MTVNPSAEPDHGTAGQTVAVNGTVAATNFVGYLNGNADTASYANIARNAEAASRLTAAGLEALLDAIYPVGSMFWTSKSPADGGNPNSFLPGVWVRIKNAFIWAAGDDDDVDVAGESDTPHGSNTRTADDLPNHKHYVDLATLPGGVHSHTVTFSAHNGGSSGQSYVLGGIGQTLHSYKSNTITTTETNTHYHLVSGKTSKTYKANGSTVQTATEMDIKPKHFIKYCWERTE